MVLPNSGPASAMTFIGFVITLSDTTSISSERDTYVIPGLLKDVTYRVRIRQRTVAGLDGVFSDPEYRKVIDTSEIRNDQIHNAMAKFILEYPGYYKINTLFAP